MYELQTKQGRLWKTLRETSALSSSLDVIQFLAQSGVAVRIIWRDMKGLENV